VYQIRGLLNYKDLFHAFSTKDEGNMANAILGKTADFKKVLESRENFLDKLGIPIDHCICMQVLGEDKFEVADPSSAGASLKDYKKAIKTDALITDKSGLYLFLLTADCAPVILFDRVRKTLCLVHVGWKGADLEIVKKVLRKLKDLYGSEPKDLVAGIGPAARRNSYIKENPSQISDIKWQPFLEKATNGGYKVDFIGLLKKQLLDVGIKGENIFDCGIDTVKDTRFFSHLRESKLPIGAQGRFACVVGLK